MLAIVAYRQPIARVGIELIRGSASESALHTLLQRGLVTHNTPHLLVTGRDFLQYAGLRDLADLPPMGGTHGEDVAGRRDVAGGMILTGA